MDRTTFLGERQFQFAAIRFTAQTAITKANAEAKAARRSESGARAASEKSKESYQKSVARFDRAAAVRKKFRSEEDTSYNQMFHYANTEKKRSSIEAEYDRALADMRAKEQNRLQANELHRSASLEAAQKEGLRGKAEAAAIRGEIDILGTKERMMSHGATAIGAMPSATKRALKLH